MRITLNRRRLVLAAFFVLAAVAAPLAWATVGRNAASATPTARAAPAAPLAALSPQTVSSSGDNPYQVVATVSNAAPVMSCTTFPLQAGVNFVLEQVTVMTLQTVVDETHIEVLVKTTPSANNLGVFEVPLTSFAGQSGMRAFNFLVRPNQHADAAAGDIYALNYCLTTHGSADVTFVLTGQKIATSTTTAVADFRAQSSTRGTVLRWTTGSENNLLGFNIWRYKAGKGVKINRTLIHAKRSGEPAGANYTFTDHAARGRGLTYRLQLVDQQGRRTWYTAFAVA